MAKLLFFSHKIIDAWSEGAKVEIKGNTLTLKQGPQGPTTFHLEEAVRFIKVSGGGADPAGLVGKIKTKKQLDEMGAEAYMESVIYKDTPYDVELGYLGRSEGAAAAPAPAPAKGAPAPAKAAAPPPPKPEEEKIDQSQVAPEGAQKDEDLLTQFLLKNL
ncbi:MAG: hypothetical protein AB1405_08635 [Bdellovibrionota bacterium]